MNPKIIRIKSKLDVRATAEAQAKVIKDLIIEDPTNEDAKKIIEKAIAKGLCNEKSEQETSQKCRTNNPEDSKS